MLANQYEILRASSVSLVESIQIDSEKVLTFSKKESILIIIFGYKVVIEEIIFKNIKDSSNLPFSITFNEHIILKEDNVLSSHYYYNKTVAVPGCKTSTPDLKCSECQDHQYSNLLTFDCQNICPISQYYHYPKYCSPQKRHLGVEEVKLELIESTGVTDVKFSFFPYTQIHGYYLILHEKNDQVRTQYPTAQIFFDGSSQNIKERVVHFQAITKDIAQKLEISHVIKPKFTFTEPFNNFFMQAFALQENYYLKIIEQRGPMQGVKEIANNIPLTSLSNTEIYRVQMIANCLSSTCGLQFTFQGDVAIYFDEQSVYNQFSLSTSSTDIVNNLIATKVVTFELKDTISFTFNFVNNVKFYAPIDEIFSRELEYNHHTIPIVCLSPGGLKCLTYHEREPITVKAQIPTSIQDYATRKLQWTITPPLPYNIQGEDEIVISPQKVSGDYSQLKIELKVDLTDQDGLAELTLNRANQKLTAQLSSNLEIGAQNDTIFKFNCISPIPNVKYKVAYSVKNLKEDIPKNEFILIQNSFSGTIQSKLNCYSLDSINSITAYCEVQDLLGDTHRTTLAIDLDCKYPKADEVINDVSIAINQVSKIASIVGMTATIPMMILGSDPTLLWALIYIMQLFFYMLFMNVRYPVNVREFLKIFSMSRLEFMPNLLQEASKDQLLYSPANFFDNDFSGLFLHSAGGMISAIGMTLGTYILLKLINFCFKKNISNRGLLKYSFKMVDSLEWSGLLRAWDVSLFELMLAGVLQIQVLKFTNLTFGLSSILAIIAMVLNCVYPIFVIKILSKDPKWLKDNNKFSFLTEDIQTNHQNKKYMIGASIIKRMLQSLAIVLLYNMPILQAICSLIPGAIFTVYLVIARPYNRIINNFIEIFKEFVFIAIHSLIAIFALDDSKPQLTPLTRNNLGLGLISCCLILMFVELLLLLAEKLVLVRELYNWIKMQFKVEKRSNIEVKKHKKLGSKKKKVVKIRTKKVKVEENIKNNSQNLEKVREFPKIYTSEIPLQGTVRRMQTIVAPTRLLEWNDSNQLVNNNQGEQKKEKSKIKKSSKQQRRKLVKKDSGQQDKAKIIIVGVMRNENKNLKILLQILQSKSVNRKNLLHNIFI